MLWRAAEGIWNNLVSITINPTIIVVMLTDKCKVLMGPFVSFDCALNNGFVRIKFDAFFYTL